MSDHEPVLQLKIRPDLPADELWDAIEFIYLTLIIYGTSIEPHLFEGVEHPHIKKISAYVKESMDESGITELPHDELQARAKNIVEKLKTYCDVTLEEDNSGGCHLVVTSH